MKKRLPKQWRGADVVRGLAMNADKLDTLAEQHSSDAWDASRPMYLVVDDSSLGDGSPFTYKAFFDEAKAIRYARACGNGNVDQRVLTIIKQTLVVATDNDL